MTIGTINSTFKPVSGPQSFQSSQRKKQVSKKKGGFASDVSDIRKELIITCAGPTALSLLAGSVVGLLVKYIPKKKQTLPAVVAGFLTTTTAALLTIPSEINKIGKSRAMKKAYNEKISNMTNDGDKLSSALDKNLKY